MNNFAELLSIGCVLNYYYYIIINNNNYYEGIIISPGVSPVFPRRCFPGVSPVFIIFPASALRFGAASLEMQRTLLCAMHSRLCVDPRRSLPAQARIHMTRGWAVESGGSTSCEWKEGGNAACSALVNCPTVHEAAKWDSPHCPRQWRR